MRSRNALFHRLYFYDRYVTCHVTTAVTEIVIFEVLQVWFGLYSLLFQLCYLFKYCRENQTE